MIKQIFLQSSLFVLIILSSYAFGLTQWNFHKNRDNPLNTDYSVGWHNYQLLTHVFLFLLGLTISQFPLCWYPLVGLLIWTFNDGIFNTLGQSPFWMIGGKNVDAFAIIAGWYVKVPLLIAGIILIIIKI